jgi:hypothetical protein
MSTTARTEPQPAATGSLATFHAITASPVPHRRLLCDGSCRSRRRNAARWLLCRRSPPTSARPIWAARYLRMNASSRLIGPFGHGSMATVLTSIWLAEVRALIPVVDAWLAAP